MNWFHVLVLAFTFVGGAYFYARARYLDQLDRDREWADIREWHLLHGPADGCIECEAK
jgi:hypothetical protein